MENPIGEGWWTLGAGYDPLWLGPWLKLGPVSLVVYSMSDARFLEVLWLGRVVRRVRLSGTPSCGTSYSR